MGIGGIFKSMVNPMNLAQLAMGPAGWASLATQMIGSAIAQTAIAQLGQMMGLPPSMISAAQNTFALASGTQGMPTSIGDAVSQVGDMFGLSPSQQGILERNAMSDLNDFVSSLSEGKDAKEARAGGKGGSWLMAIAEVLGKQLDKQAKELEEMAGQISDDTPSLTAKFGAKSQQFSMMFNATSTAIKAIGEAMSQMARKQ
ncbi:hypothetical protein [Parasphingorhabdus cellanae]|uniref:Uncharacterized protein n=1 Tax=Parasphingorhabdus cellanae TaxID=2806553 RepID=A0ABX7T7N4_9SPHN|nr:hypothetical protein [Parasphingorhabdus cellanae]QTD56142.1 hypothetical protein J4G78_00600 [Parasphingorhabdus cellanae]